MIAWEAGKPYSIQHQISQPLVSTSYVPNSAWRANVIYFYIRTPLDDILYPPFTPDFKLADGTVNTFSVIFKGNGSLTLTVDIEPQQIFLDNPNSLE